MGPTTVGVSHHCGCVPPLWVCPTTVGGPHCCGWVPPLWVCYRLIEQDVQEKEEMRKEKKRLQDQLRRIKKMEGQGKHSKVKKDKPKPETTLKVIWREAVHASCVVCE